MAYKASEDPTPASREKSILPFSQRTGQPMSWPTQRSPIRKGGVN